jgi:protein CpxP
MHAQRSGKHSEMRALKQQERDLVMSSNFDEAAAKKLAEQMVQLRAEQRVAMMQHRNEMMNVLTADQKTKLASIQQDRMNECVLFGQGGPNGQGGKGGQGPRGQGMMRGGPQGQSMAPMMQ